MPDGGRNDGDEGDPDEFRSSEEHRESAKDHRNRRNICSTLSILALSLPTSQGTLSEGERVCWSLPRGDWVEREAGMV